MPLGLIARLRRHRGPAVLVVAGLMVVQAFLGGLAMAQAALMLSPNPADADFAVICHGNAGCRFRPGGRPGPGPEPASVLPVLYGRRSAGDAARAACRAAPGPLPGCGQAVAARGLDPDRAARGARRSLAGASARRLNVPNSTRAEAGPRAFIRRSRRYTHVSHSSRRRRRCSPAQPFASAHITLENPQAPVGASYKAVLRVPHGCEKSATTAVRVRIPDGFIEVKPMPKPGWKLDVVRGKYQKPMSVRGTKVTEGVTEVDWSGGNLPDAYYDEFVLTGYHRRRSPGRADHVFPDRAGMREGRHPLDRDSRRRWRA